MTLADKVCDLTGVGVCSLNWTLDFTVDTVQHNFNSNYRQSFKSIYLWIYANQHLLLINKLIAFKVRIVEYHFSEKWSQNINSSINFIAERLVYDISLCIWRKNQIWKWIRLKCRIIFVEDVQNSIQTFG